MRSQPEILPDSFICRVHTARQKRLERPFFKATFFGKAASFCGSVLGLCGTTRRGRCLDSEVNLPPPLLGLSAGRGCPRQADAVKAQSLLASGQRSFVRRRK